MIKNCDRLICVARHTLNTFHKAISIDKNKAVIVHNALQDEYKKVTDIPKEQLKEKYFLNRETKVIVFAGRLDEVKGINFLLQAFQKVIETHLDSHLFIAGEGHFNPLLEQCRYSCTKVSFTGRLDKKQLFELYHMADMGVVSSVHEEFGFVAIEMMMHALPIIVSDTGGLREIVEDGISGLKVPVKTLKGKRVPDTTVLTEKILLLMTNEKLSRAIADGGRKRFLEKFESISFKEKMLHIYNTL
ncbi:MAG: glycosyltransferase [Tannerellaceae bacterium]|nr:glycosyltransferase [Tannerellaceae bacterium]